MTSRLPVDWPAVDSPDVPEIRAWLAALSHEQIVDVFFMVNTEVVKRGFPKVPEGVLTEEGREAYVAEVEAFCKKVRQ